MAKKKAAKKAPARKVKNTPAPDHTKKKGKEEKEREQANRVGRGPRNFGFANAT
jgi:tartrate dehydratase alpha subunit/fumarate hydratase class I-like protein